MQNFTENFACQSRAHCTACRGSVRFRDDVRLYFAVPPDFDQRCPLGVSLAPADPATLRAEIASLEAALARMHASQCKPCEIKSTEQHIARLKGQLGVLS
jgi:hypothetical protein